MKKMTKIGIISTYQRILYSSVAKKDFYTVTVSKSFSSTPSGANGNSEKVSSSKDETINKTDADAKSFNMKTGEIAIGNKNDLLKSLNLEEAKKLALTQYENQKKILEDKIDSVRVIFGGKQPRTPDEEWYAKRVSFWMKRYEDFVGLTDVKGAQARVVKYEKKFIETQELRRESQSKITDIQKKIKDIHLELEKTHRGEDRYLVLVTQEHQVLKDEKHLQEEFKQFEKTERECFSALSNAVRDSHEKERAQAEKTKYWSVLGSILGTCIGIFGTTINNRMRMNELRRLVSQNSTVEEIRAIGDQLDNDFSAHRTSLAELVQAVQNIINKADGSVENLEKMNDLCQLMKEASDKINVRGIDNNLEELKVQQELLSAAISEQREAIDSRVQDIVEDMFNQRKQLQALSASALKDREKDQKLQEKRDNDFRLTSESLNNQSISLRDTMLNTMKVIDEKMKDVRSLLLHQSQVPRETEKWIEKLERVEKTQLLLVQKGFDNVISKLDEAAETRRQALAAMRGQQRQTVVNKDNSELQLMELDNMSVLMREHQQKTQNAVIVTGLVVSVLTPVVMYAINKLI